ncbi:MAG: EAL domain-containing protein [Tissierellales bacterium]|jgi:EAL and modified HD-GYP domain-containing signal transduction protein|nr:EAL domain-containing protein [Tissierellales bacterium]
MDIFVARQPIFNRKKEVFAYELLYRENSESNRADVLDDNMATTKVLENSYFSIGFDELVNNKKAFINFNSELIKRGVPELFDQRILVVEMLEDIVPDGKLIHKCLELKKKGYLLALDDFVCGYKYKSLIKLADIIKVDFMLNSPPKRALIARKYKAQGKLLLAEKVETHEEFESALKWGYDYYQGYFFSKPKIMKGKRVSGIGLNYIRIMNEINKENPNYDRIAEIYESDIALSYKLLKLVNRFVVGGNEIKSIKHGLVMLGLREIERWTNLLLIQGLNKEKPNELFKIAIFRSKLAEIIAMNTKYKGRKTEISMMGMFSLIDTLLDRPMDNILNELPLAKDIKAAMLGEENEMYTLYQLIINYEKGSWDEVSIMADQIGISINKLPNYYMDAIEWSNKITSFLENE